ncbi:hypothetical protein EKH55_1540 [Sinorhizobium alkalisoli]|nr:hypothetical protein EKH55_1540 [Sinorhizobium alkalisoli]
MSGRPRVQFVPQLDHNSRNPATFASHAAERSPAFRPIPCGDHGS